jgi:RimJ/RimL family protein N-acetyltransferase
MNFSVQPNLTNGQVTVQPLMAADFEALYAVASDPQIWEQHPDRDRYKREVFLTFFEGAMQSGGAFKVVDNTNENILGSTRFYNYNEADNSIFIGYTFYAVDCWGKGINQAIKTLMLNYIFQYVNCVRFHVGASNMRSQIAVSRLGAQKIDEQQAINFGGVPNFKFVFEITKETWNQQLKDT